MSTCESKKKMYPTESVAEDALISAWTKYDYNDKQGPVGIYRCDMCGAYHFTSGGQMNPRLAQYISSGKIKRDAEAERWINKLKKKN